MSNIPIKSALDDSGAFYPESHERAITDDNGTTLESKLQMVKTPVLTLNSAPTSSTLTHTEGGVTYTFKVGDEVRVHDTEKGTAEGNYFVFYTLKDKSNNTAYWEESGSGGGSAPATETCLITLVSNQSGDTSLNGETISLVVDGGTTTYTWAGTAIAVSIPAGKSYTVSVTAPTGYSQPQSQSFTATAGGVSSAQFNLNTELLTVTITADETPANVSSCTVTVKDENNTTLGTLSDGQSLKIPYGTTYTCVPSSAPTDYFAISNITKDWNDTPTKNITITYECVYVDFGLPSGNKWARFNLGADTKYGTGLYFSYANIVGHEYGTYTFDQTNYDNTSGGAMTGSISPGDATYDAARAILGSPWKMPTKDDFDELITYCTYSSVEIEGEKFGVFSRNGKMMLCNLAGSIQGSSFYKTASVRYWATTRTKMLKLSDNAAIENIAGQYLGLCIRAIR